MKPRKNMFGVVISPVQFGRGLFCSSIFISFHIDNTEKINLIARSSHSNLQLFLKIYKCYNKTKPTGISSNICFIYKKLLQAFLKSTCLVKEFFLVNHSQVFFEDKFHNSYLTKYHSFLVFFSLYCQFVVATQLFIN